MNKLHPTGIVVFVFCAALCAALGATLASCPDETEAAKQFKDGPTLNLENGTVDGVAGAVYTRGHSEPRADSYDLYWIWGEGSRKEILKGTKIEDIDRTGLIEGLIDGEIVSALIAAKTAGYKAAYSDINTITVSMNGEPGPGNSVPVLTLYPSNGILRCNWTASVPPATSYDLYWIAGTVNNAGTIKSGGKKITGVTSPYDITGLTNGTVYSVLVTANVNGGMDSTVKQGTPAQASLFTVNPVLTLAPGNGTLRCNWTASTPVADTYDIYWIQGDVTDPEAVKAGTKLPNRTDGAVISNLTDTVYSIMVTANKAGYTSADSVIAQGRPTMLSFANAPVLTPSPVNNGLVCYWTASSPAADSYDIYYVAGNVTGADAVKAGTRLASRDNGSQITGLTNGTTYSLLVTAHRAGYRSVDSEVITAVPAMGTFIGMPVVSLTSKDKSIICVWSDSNPEATTYDLYWRDGTHTTAEAVKAGTKVTGVQQIHIITGLTNDTTYSVLITANRGGYNSGDSAIRTAQPHYIPSNFKRGVGYNFTTISSTNKGNTVTANTGTDMDALVNGGVNGISWFYNWGTRPNAQDTSNTVVNQSNEYKLAYAPMTWNGNYNDNDIRFSKNNMTGVEYLLAYNEPTFPNQANMTPQQAATAWPRFRAIANELGLKMISPAMNFGSMMDSVVWMDRFFELIGPEAAAEIHGIAIHTYPWFPNTVKGLLDPWRKYGKQLWLTEFCGWEDIQNREPNWQMQAWYLSQAVVYLEMDPMVERYAWYLPKGHVAETDPPIGPPPNRPVNPFHNLLRDGSSTLTELGQIYVNLTTLDKNVWVPAGQKIDAAQFTSCNLADNIGKNSSWSDIVISMPTNDTDKSAGILDIRNFTNNKWVEYQVNLTSAKNYTLTLRYRTAQSTNMQITVDGGTAVPATLDSGAWTETGIALGNLSAGNHTLRLRVTNGNSAGSGAADTEGNFYTAGAAVNWLRMD